MEFAPSVIESPKVTIARAPAGASTRIPLRNNRDLIVESVFISVSPTKFPSGEIYAVCTPSQWNVVSGVISGKNKLTATSLNGSTFNSTAAFKTVPVEISLLTELVPFFCVSSYKDPTPTEPFFNTKNPSDPPESDRFEKRASRDALVPRRERPQYRLYQLLR